MIVLNYKTYTVIREGERHTVQAFFDGDDTANLPIEADITEGDQLVRALPNGREATYRVVEVNQYENPFGGGDSLSHTEARVRKENIPTQCASPSQNFTATNMQVTAGDSYGSTMNVEQNDKDFLQLLQALNTLADSGKPTGIGDKELKHAVESKEKDPSTLRRIGARLLESLKDVGSEAMKTVLSFALRELFSKMGIPL